MRPRLRDEISCHEVFVGAVFDRPLFCIGAGAQNYCMLILKSPLAFSYFQVPVIVPFASFPSIT